MRSSDTGPRNDICSERCRAVVIRIEKQQDPAGFAALIGREQQVATELDVTSKETIAVHPDRLQKRYGHPRGAPIAQPAKQDGKRSDLSIAFNDARDGYH